MRTSTAEHCSSGRGHALQRCDRVRPAPSSLSWPACRFRRTADHAAQARHQRIERQHARARMRPSCRSELTRDCCSSRVSYWRVRSSIDSCRLCKSAADSARPRDSCCRLLKRSAPAGRRLRCRLRSRAGSGAMICASVCVQAAQLVAQSDVGALHFLRGGAECGESLLQTGAVDRDLARVFTSRSSRSARMTCSWAPARRCRRLRRAPPPASARTRA